MPRLSLASCQGFLAIASDGPVGEIAALLFPPDSAEPDFLVISAGSAPHHKRPIVPAGLVTEVNSPQRIVRLGARGDEVMRAPERLPILGA